MLDTTRLTRVVEGVGLIAPAKVLSAQELAGLERWFSDYTIARYLANGGLDTSFSSDGKDTWDVGGPQSDDRATAVAAARAALGRV